MLVNDTLGGLSPLKNGSPLVAGLPISSDDLTPPLPGPGAGTLSAGGSATLVFELQVAPATPTGTIISNQATLTSVEVPTLLTDGDGDPSTGPEPTVVVVGDAQLLGRFQDADGLGVGVGEDRRRTRAALQQLGRQPARQLPPVRSEPHPVGVERVPGSLQHVGQTLQPQRAGREVELGYDVVADVADPLVAEGEQVTAGHAPTLDVVDHHRGELGPAGVHDDRGGWCPG